MKLTDYDYDTRLEYAFAAEIDVLRERLARSKRDNRTNRDRLRSENKKLKAKLVVLENALKGLVGYCAKG